MSAIFGRFHFDESPVSSAALLPMQQAMAYWGPDGDGTWCDGHVGMGHLKRNNTPESLRDVMPWVCPASGDVITASVRLDNRDELFKGLSIPRPDQADMPDSHIILKAYQHWGEACAERLIGDWVCAIWNARERKLFIARDHHGNTGLYYYSDSRRLVFASSLKGLLAPPEVPQRPNPLAIAQILTSWPIEGAPTCYEGILCLPPAHAMTVTLQGVKIKRYWYLEHTPALHLSTDDEYQEAFLEVYAEAVRCRLRCSAPVGVTLSGGLDSGSVAALAARELGKHGQRLPSYSSVPSVATEELDYGGRFGDERPFIEAIAQSAGNIDLNYIVAQGVSPVASLEQALFIHDQPGHAASNMYWITALMAEAQKQGLGAILTGQGGNATVSWSGGPEPTLLEYLVRLQWSTFRRQLRTWQEMTKRSLWGAVRNQIVRPLVAPVRQRMQRSKASADPWHEYSAINVAFAHNLDLTRQMAKHGHDPTFSRMNAMEARLYMASPGASIAGQLWYEIGGMYGLEIRDPTWDPRVMSFCWSIPRSQYVRSGQDRRLIRRAMAGYLPDQVRLNQLKGRQGADLGQRILDHHSEMAAALTSLEQSELARQYLDLARMRAIFESLQHGINRNHFRQCGSILLRGLMVGLFLLRFET